MSYLKEIIAKVAVLPAEKQRELLDFAEFLASRQEISNGEAQDATAASPPPFRSMYGIIPRQIENLEEDLAEVRREMWQNFPREEPK